MTEGAGKIRVTFEAGDAAGMIAFCKSFLEEEGYVVEKRRPLHLPETPTQFCKRIGIAIQTFSRRIRLPNCPNNFDIERGPGGRVIWLGASAELEQFMKFNIGLHRKGKKHATKK